MKQERKFLRQCISCKKYKKKDDLIRITKNNEGININNISLIQGRSVYICKNEECITNAIKKKKIENILKSKLAENIKEELYTVLKK